MKQELLFKTIPADKYDLLSREEMITLVKGYENVIEQLQKTIEEQRKEAVSSEQTRFLLDEQILIINNKLFGKSSEKSKNKPSDKKDKKPPRKRVLLPSERYPNLDIIEKVVTLDEAPTCPCCQA